MISVSVSVTNLWPSAIRLLLQVDVIFDDAVVHDDDFAGAIAMRMRVFFGGAPVRGPARVADAVDSIERSGANRLFEIAQLAGRAPDLELAVVANDRDSGGIISAIFQALEAVEDEGHNTLRADVADDAAHLSSSLPRRRTGNSNVSAKARR